MNQLLSVQIFTSSKFHFFNLARELAKQNCRVTLVSTVPPRFSDGIASEEKIEYICYSWFGYLWKFYIRLLNFISLPRFQASFHSIYTRMAKRDIKPGQDIYIVASSFGLGLLNNLRRMSKPGSILILDRGSTHISHQASVLRKLGIFYKCDIDIPSDHIIKIENSEYEKFDYIFVPSDYVLCTFTKYGVKRSKILKNPYGVDLRAFSNKGDVGFAYDGTKNLRVLFVGAFCVRKGAGVFRDLVLRLKGKGFNSNDVVFQFVGPVERSARRFAIDIIESGLGKFEGPVAQAKLPKFYSKADVFVFPSYEEGLALVLLQALAMKVPIICSEESGGREFVSDGSAVHIVDGGIDFASQLTKITEEIITEKTLGCFFDQNSIKLNCEYFSWAAYGRRAFDAYSELLLRSRIQDKCK